MRNFLSVGVLTAAALCATALADEVSISVSHRGNDSADSTFALDRVPAPIKNDAGAKAVVRIVDGMVDPNSAGTQVLVDGKLPTDDDAPSANFFFAAGTAGGRLLLDLGTETRVRNVRSYSWHSGGRGPQVYTLFAATGAEQSLNLEPKRPVDVLTCGWKFVGKVDTRPSSSSAFGGQYSVNITAAENKPVTARYLLLDVEPTAKDDPFGNTFFSEIDVIAADWTEAPVPIAAQRKLESYPMGSQGQYTLVLDVEETPDLADWARKEIVPMAQEWYPKLIELLPSEGFAPPERVTIRISPSIRGVAATSSAKIGCAAEWFRANLKGEAKGAVFHEIVHVVQQYGRNRNRVRVPGWLTEGLADYLRWFRFEPDSRGAEITARNLPRAKYDASYRISAHFIDWASTKYAKDLAPKLNDAIRAGRYEPGLWKSLTGYTVEELGAEWRKGLEEKLGQPTSS